MIRKKFQYEFFNLTDEEAIEVLITIAKMAIEKGNMFLVMVDCPYTGEKRDFFIHFCSYIIGLSTAHNLMCGIRCCECQYNEMCPLYREINFIGEVIYHLKNEGEEGARKFIQARINSIRRSKFESEKGYV